MDAFEAFQQDVRNGRIDLERLLERLGDVYGQLRAATLRIEALEKENADLKKQLGGAATSAKIDEPFSVQAEEKRQQQRGKSKRQRKESKKQRRGRIANEEKLRRAERTEDAYPRDVPPAQCRCSHVRVALASGERPGRAGGLPHLPRPEKAVRGHPRRLGP